jgi:hypothetical protein
MIRPLSFFRTTPQAKPSSLEARCQNKSTLTAISIRGRWKKRPASPPPTETPIFMVNWATGIRMKCLKIPTAIFLNLDPMKSTAGNVARAFSVVPDGTGPCCGNLPRTNPDFLHAALDRSAYAAFFKESRTRLRGSNKLHRRSGSVLGYSQPSLRDCSGYTQRLICFQ